ncbi:MAG: TonB-dependent receptor, partial [Myxococcales bacterium]
FCKQTKTFDDAVLVGGKGGLQNVVVRIAGGVEGEHKAPTTPLVIDQKGCTYQPRVAAVMAGQPVQIRNGDMTLHNVHTYFGKETVFNRAMPNDRVPPITWDSGKDERALNAVMKLKCDVHPWMIGYVSVSKHPWFQVTGADGAFKLQNVPPGKYTLEAWHEKLGVKTQEITVEDGKTAKVEFSFDGA